MSLKVTFSNRTNWPLSENKLVTMLNSLKEEKAPIIDLTESNPTRCGFKYLNEKILVPFNEEESLTYDPHPQGSLKSREAISQYYKQKNLNVSEEQIFLTSSTSEAYSYLFRLLINPIEGVLFPQPSYPLFQFLGDLNDVEISNYPLVYLDSWRIDCNALKTLVNIDTKAIVLVNPNNPTGSFVKENEMIAINELCQKYHLSIICDEVFHDFAFDYSKKYLSCVHNHDVLTFTLGGLSKTLGLPQMKLSWIVITGPEREVHLAIKRLEIVADTYLSVNTLAQNAIGYWLSSRKQIQDEIKTRVKDNLDIIKTQTDSTASRLLQTEGGWYAVLKIPNIKTEEDWALKLLNKYHVFIHPGYFFDFTEEAYIVISLLSQTDIFNEGFNRILSRIEQEVS